MNEQLGSSAPPVARAGAQARGPRLAARLLRQALGRVWLVLAIAWAVGMPTAVQALDLSGSSPNRINLFNEISIYEDKTGELTLAQVTSPQIGALFKRPPPSGDELNLGISSSTYWIAATAPHARRGGLLAAGDRELADRRD